MTLRTGVLRRASVLLQGRRAAGPPGRAAVRQLSSVEVAASSVHARSSLAAGAALLLGLGGAAAFGGTAETESKADRIIPLTEVQDDHGTDVWVTYKGGVYNVTAFLDAHPGGPDRIMMVAGSDLHAFWDIYKLHHRPHIKALLEEFRIGSLSPEEAAKNQADSVFSSAYGDDPKRPRVEAGEMRVPSFAPFNMEPPIAKLTDEFLTPNDVFFVRNHNPVPLVDGEEWALEISANPAAGIPHDVSFTLEELRSDQERFPRTEVVAALQCAGNRQEEFITEDRPLYVAPHWRGGAIGCAKWTGVKVRDILKAAGMEVDKMSLGQLPYQDTARIVNFIGEDTDETGVPYAGVIPFEKAIDPFGDAILAYEMNDETLPRDHGFPVRLLAPGHAGCRNVKWVRQIDVTMTPSELDSGSKLDRHFSPEIDWDGHRAHVVEDRDDERKKAGMTTELPGVPKDTAHLDLAKGPVIQTLPVQSLICSPPDRSVVHGTKPAGKRFLEPRDSVEVKGIAWSGAGRGICRVEVSSNTAANEWIAAELTTAQQALTGSKQTADGCSQYAPMPEQGMGRNWAWYQWSATVPLNEAQKSQLRKGESVELEVAVKAVDGDFNSQPEEMRGGWNVLGICINHWHTIKLTLDPNVVEGSDVAKVLSKAPPPPTPAPGSFVWPDKSVDINHHLTGESPECKFVDPKCEATSKC